MDKAVLFDWDGTLYDIVDFLIETYTKVFRELGLREWSREDYRNKFTQDWRLMLPEMGLEEYENFLLNVWDRDLRKARLQLYPQARGLLIKLSRDYKIGVVSSAPKEILVKELRRLQLTRVVDLVLSKDDVEERKPSPKPLLVAAEKLGVNPADCIYVGDMVEDIQAAREAKVKSIAVSWGLHSREKLVNENPDYIVDSFSELENVIKEELK